MMMAAMRLNIPVIFVSGGPMEAGKIDGKMYDLVDAMVMAADNSVSDETILKVEKDACPTCGSCSGMFTANSMNCLAEALVWRFRAMVPFWQLTPIASVYSTKLLPDC